MVISETNVEFVNDLYFLCLFNVLGIVILMESVYGHYEFVLHFMNVNICCFI